MECKQQWRSRRLRRSGMVTLWVCMTLLLMLAFVGFAADAGWVYLVDHQLQNAADAGALAGAQQVKIDPTLAVVQATLVAQANKAGGALVKRAANPANDPGGDVVIGVYDRGSSTFTATLNSPNAVKVVCRRTSSSPGGTLPLHFAAPAGFSSSNVTCYAIAMVGGTIGAGVIVLDPSSNQSLRLVGNAKIAVTNGAVYVDSSSSSAIGFNGNTQITAPSLYITGDDTAVIAGSSLYPSGSLTLQSPPAPDPLAGLATPPKGTTQTISGSTLNPGYYPSGIDVPANKTYTLNAGIYYIDGGLTVGKNSVLNATAGVMLYIASGSVAISGTGAVDIKPPTSGTYQGISFFQAYSNTSAASITGNGSDNSGTFYFPMAPVSPVGNGGNLANQVIAYDLSLTGNGKINVDYNGVFPVQGHAVYLVK